ncbi:hypothetical protein Nepgr_014100 [Nepenthes gracilis]|uniref:Uncharacterized protein n=1 Tax=Nepenthes gracilis TaxID=150966 RepID=A0AAD3SK94_NEPGR|nr:hypothetical protein Nepgr_014100 [Nepenthes gracilis]
MAFAKEEESQSQEWDSDGLSANIVVKLNKLSGLKKRKLQKELGILATCGMFEKVNLEGKTNADGKTGVTISFTESTWQSADRFWCINVGVVLQSNQMEMEADMTDKERLELYRTQEKDYMRRTERARPCLLPMPLNREILKMLRDQGNGILKLLLCEENCLSRILPVRTNLLTDFSHVSVKGQRVLPSGGISADGPPTTISVAGIDRMVFAQGNIIRDNTKFVNGGIGGERNVFQLDQGLGIGSSFPFFS